MSELGSGERLHHVPDSNQSVGQMPPAMQSATMLCLSSIVQHAGSECCRQQARCSQFCARFCLVPAGSLPLPGRAMPLAQDLQQHLAHQLLVAMDVFAPEFTCHNIEILA